MWNKYLMFKARKRGKANAIRDWNNNIHVRAMTGFDEPTPQSDELLRNYILEGISWLDAKDRGQL